MGRLIDEHLKRMNPTGIEWADLTEQQKLELREQWDAVVSKPENLDCSCLRAGCRNNRNCRHCVALHRYFDGFSRCLEFVSDRLQAEVPQNKKYNMHYKMQSFDTPEGFIDPTENPDVTREKLGKIDTPEKRLKRTADWEAIVRTPKNTACKCPRTDCWYHGNCVKCVALHRHYEGFPECVRYIVDKVEEAIDAHAQSEKL